MTARRRSLVVHTPADLTLPPARVPTADYRHAVEVTRRIADEAHAARPLELADDIPTPRPAPTGACGHPATAWHTTSTGPDGNGQGLTCRLCSATGVIEP